MLTCSLPAEAEASGTSLAPGTQSLPVRDSAGCVPRRVRESTRAPEGNQRYACTCTFQSPKGVIHPKRELKTLLISPSCPNCLLFQTSTPSTFRRQPTSCFLQKEKQADCQPWRESSGKCSSPQNKKHPVKHHKQSGKQASRQSETIQRPPSHLLHPSGSLTQQLTQRRLQNSGSKELSAEGGREQDKGAAADGPQAFWFAVTTGCWPCWRCRIANL
ncbi:uncharacterized protein [Canis lupus baileyi]|uniref:uncharacterized protein n=1 Tax=Canis lupus baileyi TaxID=143281 RepID=UPI003B970042